MILLLLLCRRNNLVQTGTDSSAEGKRSFDTVLSAQWPGIVTCSFCFVSPFCQNKPYAVLFDNSLNNKLICSLKYCRETSFGFSLTVITISSYFELRAKGEDPSCGLLLLPCTVQAVRKHSRTIRLKRFRTIALFIYFFLKIIPRRETGPSVCTLLKINSAWAMRWPSERTNLNSRKDLIR